MRWRAVGSTHPPEKPIDWRGSTYSRVCDFPTAARREAGFQLGLMQRGGNPEDWRPMPIVGPGVIEIRVDVGTAHRLIVVAKFEEAIYVLHAFDKTSRKTPPLHIDVARRRYREVVAERGDQ